MKAVVTVAVSEDDGAPRIDRWLRRRYPQLTQGQVEKMLRTGQVRVDGARVKASDRLAPGQLVRVPPLPDAQAPRAPGAISAKDEDYVRSLVIHKDNDVIVINKPAGLAVQGGTNTVRHLDGLLPGLRFDAEKSPSWCIAGSRHVRRPCCARIRAAACLASVPRPRHR